MGKYIIIMTIILGLFTGCLTTGPDILIKKHDTPPGEYTELTAEELKEYPALKKAINGEGCKKVDENSWNCKLGSDEFYRTMDFINDKRKQARYEFFKVGDKYYEIAFLTD